MNNEADSSNRVDLANDARSIAVDPDFSLAVTCGPAAWVAERSPRHRWFENALTWIGREADVVVWRKVRQTGSGALTIHGTGSAGKDASWANDILGLEIQLPEFSDPMIQVLANAYPGLRPMGDGGLFEGLLTAIVGQSISVAAAAVTQAKLCRLYGEGIELDGRRFSPLPSPAQLAESSAGLIRQSGVTMKRAEAIVFAAQRQEAGDLPDDSWARLYPEGAVQRLLELPGVGRWTAESAVLWGIGAPDAHPTNDVALLRAARTAYNRPEMTLRDLDVLAEEWRPARALAARLLWTRLLGPAPDASNS